MIEFLWQAEFLSAVLPDPSAPEIPFPEPTPPPPDLPPHQPPGPPPEPRPGDPIPTHEPT
jgi:hypothetical protein